MNERLSTILDKIMEYSLALEKLHDDAIEAIALYNGDDFPEQQRLADRIYNDVTEAVHELPGSILGCCEDIVLVERYIGFRREFKKYDSDFLAKIIDTEMVSMETKAALKDWGHDNRAVLDLIRHIRSEWRRRVSTDSFSSIKALMDANIYEPGR